MSDANDSPRSPDQLSDAESREIDDEIVDQERAAELVVIADEKLFDLNLERRLEFERIERNIEDQMADIERESDPESERDG